MLAFVVSMIVVISAGVVVVLFSRLVISDAQQFGWRWVHVVNLALMAALVSFTLYMLFVSVARFAANY